MCVIELWWGSGGGDDGGCDGGEPDRLVAGLGSGRNEQKKFQSRTTAAHNNYIITLFEMFPRKYQCRPPNYVRVEVNDVLKRSLSAHPTDPCGSVVYSFVPIVVFRLSIDCIDIFSAIGLALFRLFSSKIIKIQWSSCRRAVNTMVFNLLDYNIIKFPNFRCKC